MTTKDTMPVVSVVVPMRNAEPFISATLASILQERNVPLEVVVVNDCSTDASLERVNAISDNRVRVINGPCRGVAAALNEGLAAARGEIIMRCDADDLYPPQRIARQVKWLVEHPEYGAVCGNYSMINVKGKLVANLECGNEAQEITEELRNSVTRTHFGTFAVRAEVLRTSGGSREYFRTSEDIDLQLRLGELCRIGYVPDIQYRYRLHQKSLTHTQSKVEVEFFESKAREFQRQRQTQGSDDLQRSSPPALPQGGSKSALKAAAHVQEILIGRAWSEHRSGNKPRALLQGVRSVIVQPTNKTAWRSLVALAVKPAGRELAVKSPARELVKQ